MTKSEYITRHGLTVRPVNDDDKKAARTDCQRYADFIISRGGIEWYSMNGSLSDCRRFVKWNREEWTE